MKINGLAPPRFSLGKGEVESSILSSSTSLPLTDKGREQIAAISEAQAGAERRTNAPIRDVQNPWNLFRYRSCLTLESAPLIALRFFGALPHGGAALAAPRIVRRV